MEITSNQFSNCSWIKVQLTKPILKLFVRIDFDKFWNCLRQKFVKLFAGKNWPDESLSWIVLQKFIWIKFLVKTISTSSELSADKVESNKTTRKRLVRKVRLPWRLVLTKFWSCSRRKLGRRNLFVKISSSKSSRQVREVLKLFGRKVCCDYYFSKVLKLFAGESSREEVLWRFISNKFCNCSRVKVCREDYFRNFQRFCDFNFVRSKKITAVLIFRFDKLHSEK